VSTGKKLRKGIIIPNDNNTISEAEIKHISRIDYPIFSFKHLQEVSFDKCKDVKFFMGLLKRLKGYSELGWKQMATDKKHGYGWEFLPQEQIEQALPKSVTPEVDLMVLRASNDNKALVGFREWNIFHILFIEANFNDIYNHG